MYLDERDTLNLSQREEYEPLITGLFREQLREGDVVVDVGAHIGYYTLLAAKLVGSKGHVYSFEPDPKNFRLLEKNVAVNKYRNVTLLNKAAGDRKGTVRLYQAGYNKGDHRLFDDVKGRSSVEVPMVRVYSVVRKSDLVKVDVQGAEMLVLEGMKSLLSRESVKLISEVEPASLRSMGASAQGYFSDLWKLGFKIQHVNSSKGRLEPLDEKRFLKEYEHRVSNIFCRK
ncbi:FkbM family methyltransferase [Candidatus Woesearchaeota archaeon]|nr:FkbM family methyltransferase [Candidatus Woesearchaeota archaeon]